MFYAFVFEDPDIHNLRKFDELDEAKRYLDMQYAVGQSAADLMVNDLPPAPRQIDVAVWMQADEEDVMPGLIVACEVNDLDEIRRLARIALDGAPQNYGRHPLHR